MRKLAGMLMYISYTVCSNNTKQHLIWHHVVNVLYKILTSIEQRSDVIFFQKLPALKSFCVFSCIGIVGLFCYAATFFVACVAIDINRTRQERNGCLCCYKHKADYEPNKCSERNLLVTFIRKFYATALLKLPVKVWFVVTLLCRLLLGSNS